jgi:hypothetical protein
MRVFNLTAEPLAFRTKVIPPSGGSLDFQELDFFIPNREQELARAGTISFGSLPRGWVPKVIIPPPPPAKTAPVKVVEKQVVQEKVEKVYVDPKVAEVALLPEEKKPEPVFQSTAEKFKKR